MRLSCVLVLALAVVTLAQDSFDSSGARLVLKIYEDCSKADEFSPCLKKKAITFMDRLARMDKLTLVEGVSFNLAADATPIEPAVTEEQLETQLPRAADAKDEALTNLLIDKTSKFIGSRTLEVTLPKMSELIEEGRRGGGGGGGGGGLGGGGGGGGGKHGMKGMMGGMMMGIAAKMAALVPIAIAGLFLLAGKALITAKIALLISGIIAIKKLFASKQGGGGGGHGHGGGGGGGGGGHGGWQSSGGGGGGGGWQSSGGGWDKRSLNEAQKLAYKAYSPK